jgi:hypothetical protein
MRLSIVKEAVNKLIFFYKVEVLLFSYKLSRCSNLIVTFLNLVSYFAPIKEIFMSVDHQIHIANENSESIYVLPVPNVDWVWGDVGFDIATTAIVSVATLGTGTVAAGANAVKSLSTFQKVIKIAKTIAEITEHPRAIATLVSRADKAATISNDALTKEALKSLESAKKFLGDDAIKIEKDEFKQIFKQGVWSPTRYISPTGIGAALGGSDMTLFIITESFSRMVTFNTNGDYSWIVGNNEVVRAKYGKIWQESRNDGFYRLAISDKLHAPQYLLPGQCLSSPNGDYNFLYQEDGNAVVYERDKPRSESPIWSSNTSGKPAGRAIIQEDGNFVLYGPDKELVWATNRFGSSSDYEGSQLCMQNDGNLVVYKADGSVLWASKG